MIRLKKIKIIGFKDPSYEKELVFSTEPISVIYGENGSGKTTFLKILFAVFSKDEKILLQEKVSRIEIDYQKDDFCNTIIIKKTDKNTIDWGNNLDIFNTTSILFGVHRGVIQEKTNDIILDKNTFSEENAFSNKKNFLEENTFSYLNALFQKNIFGKNTFLEENIFLKKIITESHLSTDFVKINDIQNAIVSQFQKGQNIVSDKIKKAFFETIEKAVEIDETGQDFLLPNDFEKRIKDKKSFILKAIPKENSYLTKRIKIYLETGDTTLTEKSKIFRAMLLNIIESAEEQNPTLEAITKLIEIFNEHLYKDKKLIVDIENAYIDLGNDKFHNLTELSSGERNLLSLLTLFLIIGNERNFLMIDEPEISLNIKWQRDFLPLLSRLNSKAQIIVASHSPSIAHKNSKYLVELK